MVIKLEVTNFNCNTLSFKQHMYDNVKVMKNLNFLLLKLREIVLEYNWNDLKIVINDKNIFLSDLQVFKISYDEFNIKFTIIRTKFISILNIPINLIALDELYRLIDVSHICRTKNVSPKVILSWLEKFQIFIFDCEYFYVTKNEYDYILTIIEIGLQNDFDIKDKKINDDKEKRVNVIIRRYLNHLGSLEIKDLDKIQQIESNLKKYSKYNSLFNNEECGQIINLIKCYSFKNFNAHVSYLKDQNEKVKSENRNIVSKPLTDIPQITGDYDANSVYTVKT